MFFLAAFRDFLKERRLVEDQDDDNYDRTSVTYRYANRTEF